MRKRTANKIELAKKDQGNKCACCGTAGSFIPHWSPDYKPDTKPKLWRGAVCYICKQLIDAVEHDPERLKKVQAYLKQGGFKKPKAK